MDDGRGRYGRDGGCCLVRSYNKSLNVGHKGLRLLLDDEVLVEEKVDGSQFSFMRQGDDLRARSRSADIHLDAPDKMFANAATTVKELGPELHEGWIYRGEYLSRPKHNALAYDRVPVKHVIIFDIEVGEEDYLSYEEKTEEATRLGLETVPRIRQGKIDSVADFRSMLATTSCLGGQLIEGVVIKNYHRFGLDGRAKFGKFVSESFKEVHRGEWKSSNPTTKDIVDRLFIVDRLINQYKTPARWNKSIQHLGEANQLEHSPKDIGKLIKEVQSDVKTECEEEIKQALFDHFWGQISRGIIHGVPEHYKQRLLEESFQ
jgi:hypothetical protein